MHVRQARGVKLQLSGHTHGGQIIGMDQLVKRANGGFVSGRYDVDGMTLYVSNGAGLCWFPGTHRRAVGDHPGDTAPRTVT